MFRTLLIVGVSIVGLFVGSDVCVAQDVYEVSIQNDWNDTVRLKRVDDSEGGSAFADLKPGDSDSFRIQFTSDQVFAAWGRGRLLGVTQFKLNPRIGTVSLTVTRDGQLVAALKGR